MRYLLFFIITTCAVIRINAQSNSFPSSGNAGIGTTNPVATLEVSSSAPGNSPFVKITNTSGATPNTFGPGLILENGVAGSHPYIIQQHQNAGSYFAIANFSNPYTPYFVIDQSGNIGIGTTVPQAKLAVNGDIYSKKIKVTQLGWADYVFHASYRLRPLSEVEQFIQQYQHLPEVPSAAEVEKNGIDLGDNQATLLKKIEELTLYLIEQNKKIETLEKEMQQLRRAKNVPVN